MLLPAEAVKCGAIRWQRRAAGWAGAWDRGAAGARGTLLRHEAAPAAATRSWQPRPSPRQAAGMKAAAADCRPPHCHGGVAGPQRHVALAAAWAMVRPRRGLLHQPGFDRPPAHFISYSRGFWWRGCGSEVFMSQSRASQSQASQARARRAARQGHQPHGLCCCPPASSPSSPYHHSPVSSSTLLRACHTSCAALAQLLHTVFWIQRAGAGGQPRGGGGRALCGDLAPRLLPGWRPCVMYAGVSIGPILSTTFLWPACLPASSSDVKAPGLESGWWGTHRRRRYKFGRAQG
jgi:hypothetical protein